MTLDRLPQLKQWALRPKSPKVLKKKKFLFRIFQRRFIVFVSLLVMPLLGCHISNQGAIFNKGKARLVRELDAVMLTANDLPTMKLDTSSSFTIPGFGKQPPVVDGFTQYWKGTQPEERITIRYWLLRSVEEAKKAAEDWRHFLASQGFYEPEPNPEDVIGDATWRIENASSLWFVKNNVLVYVRGGNPFVNQLTLTRSVARKIETKINNVNKE